MSGPLSLRHGASAGWVGGTAYSMEGNLEYFEYAIADSRHVVVLRHGVLVSF